MPLFFIRHCRCCRRCHGIERWHREEGEEDERRSKQLVRAAHCWGDAPPPAPHGAILTSSLASLAIFSDSGMGTCIFLGRIFCAR